VASNSNHPNKSTWFVTGSSTGLGRALTEVLLEHGHRVAASARNPSALNALKAVYGEHLLCPALDVTDPVQVRRSLQESIDHFGRIDVLVNNAGYGLIGAVEEVTDEEIRRQFDTNFFGALDVTRAILPHFRSRKTGHIVNISSIGGFRAIAGAAIYNATKFALEALSEALAREVGPLGIRVVLVEPGPFRTDFGGRSINDTTSRMPEYVATAGKMREYYQAAHGKQVGDPRKAAEAIIQAVESKEDFLRLPLGEATLKGMREKIGNVEKDLSLWEQVAINTAFTD
jgi:NAD(P)-dependent dehydrogenase (short-subunit alcohol dehydrogenase family)